MLDAAQRMSNEAGCGQSCYSNGKSSRFSCPVNNFSPNDTLPQTEVNPRALVIKVAAGWPSQSGQDPLTRDRVSKRVRPSTSTSFLVHNDGTTTPKCSAHSHRMLTHSQTTHRMSRHLFPLLHYATRRPRSRPAMLICLRVIQRR